VPFEIALLSANLLDRQGVALGRLFECQGTAAQCLKHGNFSADRPPPGVERRQLRFVLLARARNGTESD